MRSLSMPFIFPFRSLFRPYNRVYAYRGLTAFAPLSIAVIDCVPLLISSIDSSCSSKEYNRKLVQFTLCEITKLVELKVFEKLLFREVLF
ncbi:MAG: hypothetical protein KZQ63_14145 [Candidatus Thiodiazotropha sp. (ex Lucinoma aequizonata)]|nr:hypothetical protein [Candidatus Thiodiazotropha sp. (ex Lucinoma aequizonata)]